MTPWAQREKRKKWNENSQTYLKKKEVERKVQTVLIENLPSEIDIQENTKPLIIHDPLKIEITGSIVKIKLIKREHRSC